MDQEKLDQIAQIIHPYLKTKHKEKQSQEIARKILEELGQGEPTIQ